MSRWYSDRPHSDDIADLRNSGGRIADLPAHPIWRAVAWGAMAVAALALLAWIAVPAVKALVDAARPDACRTLTGAECTALAQDGGW